MLASIVGRGRLRGGTRVAAAAGVAVIAVVLATMTAVAATDSFSVAALPPSPFHLVVGDQLTLSDSPPVLPPPPPGQMYTGPATASMPSTSDTTILTPSSTSVDASGVARATFQAIHAGTADVVIPYDSPCLISIPSTATTTVTTTVISSSTTTTRTSTSTSTAAASGVCAAGLIKWQVIVDAGVQGASTSVPAAGVGSVPWPGVGLLFAGMAVVVAVIARRDTRNRRG